VIARVRIHCVRAICFRDIAILRLFERKYDGIRLMLHKSTDARGSVLCAAYTRGRRDWMELVLGLRQTIELFGARSVIVDGELYGLVADHEGVVRPATVYEVYGRLQGEARRPINLKYAAFDVVYLNSTICGRLLPALRGTRAVLHVHVLVDRIPRHWHQADVVLADSTAIAQRLDGLPARVVVPADAGDPAAQEEYAARLGALISPSQPR